MRSPRSAPKPTSTRPGWLHADGLRRRDRGEQVHELVTRA